jgi:hypothetical protein
MYSMTVGSMQACRIRASALREISDVVLARTSRNGQAAAHGNKPSSGWSNPQISRARSCFWPATMRLSSRDRQSSSMVVSIGSDSEVPEQLMDDKDLDSRTEMSRSRRKFLYSVAGAGAVSAAGWH